jgi:hypothetical protein
MGCDWYAFTTTTGYGVPVRWQDIAKAYKTATGNKDEDEEDESEKLSNLKEWLLTKTAEVQGLKIYDVGRYYAFFTLRGLSVTSGESLSVPGPYEIDKDETQLVGLNQIQNLPGYAEDDQLLEGIAQQVTPPDELLNFPSGSWLTKLAYGDPISLLKRKGNTSNESQVSAKKSKTDSGDKCLFIVGAEKKEIAWDRNALAGSNPTLKNILFGTGQIKPDPSKPVEWPEYHPDSVELIFKALPRIERMNLGSDKAKRVPDEVYKSCKVLADYLGIDFYRLSIASDRFKKNSTVERYKNDEDEDEEEDNEDEEEDSEDEEEDNDDEEDEDD